MKKYSDSENWWNLRAENVNLRTELYMAHKAMTEATKKIKSLSYKVDCLRDLVNRERTLSLKEVRRLRKRVEGLEAENFTLAAVTCPLDKAVGDEHGHVVCAILQPIAAGKMSHD